MNPEKETLPVVISYSGGASSERLVQLVIRGEVARPEHLAVVCADTGDEHEWTYEAMSRVEGECRTAGIDFLRCSDDEKLSDHLMGLSAQTRETKRLDHPPLWIDKGGGTRGRAMHRCTRRFKVAPMRRAVSEWLAANGLPKRVTKWLGFGTDEAHRAMKAVGKQDVEWEKLDFPLIRLGFNRGRVRADLANAPRFSMCLYCPYKSADRWRGMSAGDFAKATAVDDAIRDLDEIGLTDGPAYCSGSLTPLRLGPPAPSAQLALPGLDSGCDSGACFL